ncbi:MAG: YIP1 family protein [Acidobacteria bacterium]|nr:YIP1 family protein [Acidobacteriota bacterium]
MRNLIAILFRPAETIQRILAQPQDRMVIPLVLLAVCANALRDVALEKLQQTAGNPKVLGIVAAVCVGMMMIAVGAFYVLAWIAVLIGRIFDGQGSVRAMRSALAWGLAPVILSLVYRLPMVFLPQPSGFFAIAFFALLRAALVLWWVAITSVTIAEAEKFSPWSGLATLVLTALAPAVVMGAALLTMFLTKH